MFLFCYVFRIHIGGQAFCEYTTYRIYYLFKLLLITQSLLLYGWNVDMANEVSLKEGITKLLNYHTKANSKNFFAF